MPKTHVETAPKSYLTTKQLMFNQWKNWYLSLITTKSHVWPPKTLNVLTFDPQNHRIFSHKTTYQRWRKSLEIPDSMVWSPTLRMRFRPGFVMGDPQVTSSHHGLKHVEMSWAGWLGYGSIPMKIPFLMGWTSILTQLFWCEQYRGFHGFWHTATWIWGYPDDLDDFSIWNMEIEFFKNIQDVGDMKPTNSSSDLWDLGLRKWWF